MYNILYYMKMKKKQFQTLEVSAQVWEEEMENKTSIWVWVMKETQSDTVVRGVRSTNEKIEEGFTEDMAFELWLPGRIFWI